MRASASPTIVVGYDGWPASRAEVVSPALPEPEPQRATVPVGRPTPRGR